MNEIQFRIPRNEHIIEIVDNIRTSDKVELHASGKDDILETVTKSVVTSEVCVVACIADKPMVIYGMRSINILTDTALIWMVGVEESLKHSRKLVVYTKLVINEMLKEYSELTNYVHSENKASIGWLKVLGFTISEPIMINGNLFHKFYIRRR